MSETFNNIIRGAETLGACGMIKTIHDERSAADALFKPQGIEFCASKDYPKAAQIDASLRALMQEYGIFVDCGDIIVKGHHRLCFIGKCRAKVKAQGCNYLHTILALDGAEVEIEASMYATGTADASRSARITLSNQDATARISCRQEK
ncbi:MAG: hypothetical protein HDR49_00145 [Bacteroides sp.]|nr:hypothetical protein [Bacteroides sp.]